MEKKSWRILQMVFSVATCANFAAAQGPLTPPGPPASLLKTLEQLEPRTDVLRLPGSASIAHIIDRPGSYYLTGNLVVTNQSGIRILSDDVTLDLNGFALLGATNRTAILGSTGLERVRIRNGILSGWSTGIDFLSGGACTNAVLEDLAIAIIGGDTYGIYAGPDARVARCRVTGVTGGSGFGIILGERSTVESSEVLNSLGGILVGAHSTVRDCVIKNCPNSEGISAGDSSIVQHNRADRTGGGIRVGHNCLVLENICTRSDGHGIYLFGSHSRVDGNVMNLNSGNGIQTAIGTSNNVVIRNLARGNTNANYSFLGSVARGPTVTTTGVITNHPWANFSY
jgi:hypothetical protein